MSDKIVTHPDERLRLKSKPVKLLMPSTITRIEEMFRVMYQGGGIGLAANQVGWRASIFVVDIMDGKQKVFINPEILWESEETVTYPEGCLSVPGKHIWISRPKAIKVRSRNLEWELVELEADGILARVIQHEKGHLDGELITDYENS